MLVYDHAPEASLESDRPTQAAWRPASILHPRGAGVCRGPDRARRATGQTLCDVDMRLRPSGGKGPVAVSPARRFERYHRGGSAWTWERLALTRARVVAGPVQAYARQSGGAR